MLRQSDSEDAEKGALRFWYIEGSSGHITVAPDGGFWISVGGSPPFVAWAKAQLASFCKIRRTGANSLLAEMRRLPKADEAEVLRQALAIPLARALWRGAARAKARA